MWQRNNTKYEQNVSAWPTDEYPDLAPFTVGVDEEIDFPYLIGGFVLVPGPQPEPNTKRKNATAVVDTKEEGEPQ